MIENWLRVSAYSFNLNSTAMCFISLATQTCTHIPASQHTQTHAHTITTIQLFPLSPPLLPPLYVCEYECSLSQSCTACRAPTRRTTPRSKGQTSSTGAVTPTQKGSRSSCRPFTSVYRTRSAIDK